MVSSLHSVDTYVLMPHGMLWFWHLLHKQDRQAGIVSQTMMKYLMEVLMDDPNLEYFIFSHLNDILKIGISNIFHIVEVNIFNGIV